MIKLINVTKSYKVGKNNIDVLKNINLSINHGEFLAIMGPSGSGKSTLMNIIGCLDKPSNGNYLFNTADISTYSARKLAKLRNLSIGFVFQQFHLLPRLNVYKNVELPMVYAGCSKKDRNFKVMNALEKVNLDDKVNYFPNELSGGQKQRVAIARSIVNKPKLILADEPTGALDTNTGFSIMKEFQKLNNDEKTTIVIVTHEQEIAHFCNKVIYVRDGNIVKEKQAQRRGWTL